MGVVKTAGIFFVRNDGKILIGHPTHHRQSFWSIPKGRLEEGEEPLDAALRETYEEANLDLGVAIKYYELPSVLYKSKKKRLYPFVVLETENRKLDSNQFDIKCNAYVSTENGEYPEMDQFKYVTLEEAKELLHHSQVECLELINEILTNKNV